MSKEHKHIDHLTPELIRQYRAGELSPATRHAVEKYLLENPFEAEAMEGLEMMSREAVDLHIEDLHAAIDQRVRPGVVDKGATEFWNYTRRLAAVILLLLIAGMAYVWLRPAVENSPMTRELTASDKPDKSESTDSLGKAAAAGIAKQKEESSKEESKSKEEVQEESLPEDIVGQDYKVLAAPAPQMEIVPEVTEGSNLITYISKENDTISVDKDELFEAYTADIRKKIDELNQINMTKQSLALAGTESKAAMAVSAAPMKVEDSVPIQRTNAYARSMTLSVPMPKVDGRAMLVPQNTTPANRTIGFRNTNLPVTGKVSDAVTGLALSGAVIATATNRKTETDENGFFTIQPDSSNRMLSVSYAGYTPRQYQDIIGNDLLRVNLTPSSVLEQSLNTRLRGSGLVTLSHSSKVITSIEQFETYAAENLRYPEAARAKKVKGKVVLEVRISDIGKVGDIKVIRGLGHGCNEEAIRLLKEGPAWAPKFNKKTGLLEARTVRVKVRFKP